MSFDNGSGQGGGNSSVWFEVRHGSDARPQRLEPHEPFAPRALAAPDASSPAAHRHQHGPNGGERPAQGHVKLDNDGKCACLSIHDSTNLDHLGGDDHKGMFRVRLRIRKETMEQLIAEEKDPERKKELKKYWMALPLIAAKLKKLTGDVPRGPNEVWDEADTADDVFLIVDVPAIKRKPGDGEPWPFMPWEIYWQW
jgi:hypothetical protein